MKKIEYSKIRKDLKQEGIKFNSSNLNLVNSSIGEVQLFIGDTVATALRNDDQCACE